MSFRQSKLQHDPSKGSIFDSHLAISSFLIFHPSNSKFPLFSILLAASYFHYLIFSYLFFFSYISIHTHTHTQTHTYTHTYSHAQYVSSINPDQYQPSPPPLRSPLRLCYILRQLSRQCCDGGPGLVST